MRERDSPVCETLLDEAVHDSVLASHYPVLQVQAGVNEKAVQRLLESLALGLAPIFAYRTLAMGRAVDDISISLLREMLLRISDKPDGFGVAIEILHMRLSSNSAGERQHATELIKVGQELLTAMDFANSELCAGTDSQFLPHRQSRRGCSEDHHHKLEGRNRIASDQRSLL
jgi:hypothetical protein